MLTWNLLLAGGGVGIAQVILAQRHQELEQVEAINWQGYHLYYPNRRHPSPAFAALVNALRFKG